MANDPHAQFLAVEALAVRPQRAAELLGVSRPTIYHLMEAGELASFKVGSARRIPVDELREFIARRVAAETAA